MKRLASVAVVIWIATLGANTGGLALSYARSSSRRRPTPCGANTVSLSLPRPRPDTDHAPGMGRRGRPDAPRVSQARSRREPPRRRGSGHRHVHGPTSRIRGRLRAWLAPPWPSPLPSLARCPHWGSSLVGFTQIADATDPVRGLTPCQRPPAGRRSRRLVVCSRLHASKPSFERTVTISSGVPAQPCSCSIHVIRPCWPRALKPVIVRIMVPCA